MSILNALEVTSNSTSWVIFFIILASIRIYLEVLGIDLAKFPLSHKLAQVYGENHVRQFHRLGLYICIGYIILFAPGLLL